MLVIRFTKIGRKNDPKFRIIVKEKRSKRDGKYIDLIGFYDPVANPHILRYDQAKLDKWLMQGAQLSEGVAKIIKVPKKEKVAKKTASTKKVTPKATVESKTAEKKLIKKTATPKKTSTAKKVVTKK